MRRLATVTIVAAAALCALPPESSPAFTLDFTFTGTVPAGLQSAVNYAGGLWESWLLDTGTGENENLEIAIDHKELGAGVLGEAGVSYVWYDSSYAYVPSMGTLLYGFDDNVFVTDGIINFNNQFSWYYPTDGNPGTGQYDAVTVALHEIGHQVGFYPTYQWSKANTWGVNVSANQYRLTHWDTLLRDETGNAPAAGEVNDDFNETDNPVYFIGSEAVAENGGNVPIYAPATYSPGSSLSHLNQQAIFEDYLMSFSLNPGEAIHSLSAVEVAMLRDLGWNAVPEPATAVMLVLGGLAVLSKRTRRKA
jgi:hypothetical protein